jgi:hypothetical protein
MANNNTPTDAAETPEQGAAAPCVSAAAAPSNAPSREADQIAQRLVAAVAPRELAAGARDKEAGPPLFTDLLGHELASSHHVLMRFAAAANAMMGKDLGSGRGRARRVIAAQLAGARAAASAGRVLDFTRLALVAWGRRRPVADEGERWVFLRMKGTVLTPERIARRRAAAQARLAAQRAAEGTDKPALGPATRDLLAQATRPATALTEAAGAAVLAARVVSAGGAGFMRRLFTDELVAIHALKSHLDGRSVGALDHALARRQVPLAACRLAEGAARMGDRFRRGLASLDLFDATPTGTGGEVHYFYLDPDLEETAPAAQDPAPATATSTAVRPRFYADASMRRGRLANGNPTGDFQAAPRCGARTRQGGCCRQPAMASRRGGGGRCRFHGGKSTGPRTAQGLARARAARLVHGGYSAEIIDLRKEAARRVRRLRALIAAANQTRIPAGHGVHRHDRTTKRLFAGHVAAEAPGAKAAGVHSHQPAHPASAALAISGRSGYEPARLRNPHAGLAADRGEIPAVAPVFPASATG